MAVILTQVLLLQADGGYTNASSVTAKTNGCNTEEFSLHHMNHGKTDKSYLTANNW